MSYLEHSAVNKYLSLLCVLMGVTLAHSAAKAADDRPNLLVIITDQQHAGMMSCAGNEWLKTPAMDRLAAEGVRFQRAYAANPVCLPARFSMLTGLYPSAIGVRHNGSRVEKNVADMPRRAMGNLLRRAGYETAYGGKVHLPGPMNDIVKCGFKKITAKQREPLAEACEKFLARKHEKPFLLVASFINPHDICYMAIRAHDSDSFLAKRTPQPLFEALKLPDGVAREEFFAKHCPPLPANFEPTEGEADAIGGLIDLRPFRRHVRDNWTASDWRLHRWAYCRLTERVDAQVGRVLDALDKYGLKNDTVVIFTSDHGDMDAAHRMEHKTTFYEESVDVPFIVRYPGRAKKGLVDDKHLISAGLDLLPTLCDYAEVEPPDDLPGRSVRPLAEGIAVDDWRKSLIVENQIGTMVHSGRYKYSRYDTGKVREMFIDLQADPGEMKNLIDDPAYREVIGDHRKRLDEYLDRQKRRGAEIAR